MAVIGGKCSAEVRYGLWIGKGKSKKKILVVLFSNCVYVFLRVSPGWDKPMLLKYVHCSVLPSGLVHECNSVV